MLLRLLEEKRPVDLILYCDTELDFPQMYDHINRLEEYIGRPITRLKAPHDFEYYFYEYTPKRKNPDLEPYKGLSWAAPTTVGVRVFSKPVLYGHISKILKWIMSL